jgi:PTS system cellobiose-specific IIA component
MEQIILNIIIQSGDARSFAMEAIQCAKIGEFDKAQELMEQSREKLGCAHQEQTKLIHAEAGGQKTEITLLLIHAQDHLMTAITVKDLANEMIDLYSRL